VPPLQRPRMQRFTCCARPAAPPSRTFRAVSAARSAKACSQRGPERAENTKRATCSARTYNARTCNAPTCSTERV